MERITSESGLALAVLTNLSDQAVSIDAARPWFTEDCTNRFLTRFTAFLFRFPGCESWLALASGRSVRLFDALSVWAARIGLATRQFDCNKTNVNIIKSDVNVLI